MILALSAGLFCTVLPQCVGLCSSEGGGRLWGQEHHPGITATYGGMMHPGSGARSGLCGGHRTDCVGSAPGREVFSCATAPPRPRVHASFQPLATPPQPCRRRSEVPFSRETATREKLKVRGSVRGKRGGQSPHPSPPFPVPFSRCLSDPHQDPSSNPNSSWLSFRVLRKDR